MMGRRAYGVQHRDRAAAGRRQAPLRPQGAAARRRRRPAADARALRHAAALAAARVPLDARGRRAGRDPAQRLADELPHRRGRDRRRRVASAPARRSIRTTQDLMILAGLPPVVREGDRFRRRLHAAQHHRRRAGRDAARERRRASRRRSRRSRCALAAGESREVELGRRGAGRRRGARAGSSTSRPRAAPRDRLRVAQRVVPAVPVRVLQATLLQVAPARRRSPSSGPPTRSRIAAASTSRCGRSLADGPRRRSSARCASTPTRCLEQQASIAVALRDAARWRAVDGGAARATSTATGSRASSRRAAPGSEVLTAYLLALADEARPRDPGGAARAHARRRSRASSQGELDARRGARAPPICRCASSPRSRRSRATGGRRPSWSARSRSSRRCSRTARCSTGSRSSSACPRSRAATRASPRPSALLRARLDVQGTTLGFATSRGGALDWLLATADVERRAPRALAARARRPGATTRRASCAARSRSSAAAPGRRRPANAWGVARARRASRRAFEATPVAGDDDARARAARESAHRLGGDAGRRRARASRGRRRARGARAAPRRQRARRGRWSRALAALPLREPFASGYRIEKRVEPVSQRTPGVWSRGDVARVRLEVDGRRGGELGGGRAIRSRPARRSSAAASAATPRCSPPASATRATPGRPSPSARQEAFAPLLRVRAEGHASPSSTPCASTRPGRFAAAADARRGDVRARADGRARRTSASRSRRDGGGARSRWRARLRARARRRARDARRRALPRRSRRSARAIASSRGACCSIGTARVLHERRVDPHGRRLAWTPLADDRAGARRGAGRQRGSPLPRARRRRLAARSPARCATPRARGRVRGASTLTMQLAALLDPALRAGATPRGVAREAAPDARRARARARWSKDEILEAYLNLASFRGELAGVAAASRGLFDREPHGLGAAEAALLAALLRAPNARARARSRRARAGSRSGAAPTAPPCDAIERARRRRARGGAARAARARALAPHLAARLLRGAPRRRARRDDARRARSSAASPRCSPPGRGARAAATCATPPRSSSTTRAARCSRGSAAAARLERAPRRRRARAPPGRLDAEALPLRARLRPPPRHAGHAARRRAARRRRPPLGSYRPENYDHALPRPGAGARGARRRR